MEHEFDDYVIEVKSYGLYEDLYKCVTLSIEQAYEEYWKEENGEV